MHEIHKSYLAEKDLIGIWRYSCENWGEAQADFYVDQIDEKLRMVASNPEIGTDASEIKRGYRKIKSGKHVVFYRFGNDVLEVVRILHQKMDIENHL